MVIKNGSWSDIERYIEELVGDKIQSSNCSGYFDEKLATSQYFTFIGLKGTYNAIIRPMEHRKEGFDDIWRLNIEIK